MRKSHDNQFKAKVALEALREGTTIQELAKKYEIHPGQVSQWKKQVIESLPNVFERPNKKSEQERTHESEKDMLLKTVGEMKVENNFLKKKYRQLYGKEPF